MALRAAYTFASIRFLVTWQTSPRANLLDQVADRDDTRQCSCLREIALAQGSRMSVEICQELSTWPPRATPAGLPSYDAWIK